MRVAAHDQSGPAVVALGIGERLLPRLSIAVLPFANLSNDIDQQYFTDAITDDVMTDPSRIAGMFMISRSIAFIYKASAQSTGWFYCRLRMRCATYR
jgi:adenylate cyclase